MSLIVPQVLNNNNYKIWSACMKDYFSSQGLWDVVIDDKNNSPSSEDEAEWKKKNGMALHAIKISCAPIVLSQIGFAERASDAWRQLERIQKRRDKGTSSDTLQIRVGIESRCEGIGSRNERLLEWVQEGNVDGFDALTSDEGRSGLDILKEIVTSTKGTLIHAAIMCEKVDKMKFLVNKISRRDLHLLEIVDANQFTPLDTIAAHIGNRKRALEMAKCITDKFPDLVTHGVVLTPILIASAHAHKDMTNHLYRVIAPANHDDRPPRVGNLTIVDDLNAESGRLHGTILLSQCINGKMFDIASDLLRRFPGLASKQCGFVDPIHDLCKLPSAFSCESLYWKESIKSYLCSGRLLRVMKCLGIVPETFEDKKKIHSEAKNFLKSICKQIAILEEREPNVTSVREAMLEAAKNGIAEFITEMVRANNQRLMLFFDDDRRNIFSYAVIYRREKVFNLIYGVSPKGIDDLTNIVDSYDNNMLHLAANMSESSSTFDATSGAALQMQRELQWFKTIHSIYLEEKFRSLKMTQEVERLCEPSCKEMLNQDGLTPRQLFTASHKKLVREGENWMKTTAQSSSVVVALIVTVTFASAITVPGGSDQTNGFPMFLARVSFKTFTVLNALSFFLSLTSVLMFLGILTSRYAEEDFLLTLPTKLIVGLTSLSLSIATMMATFCCALVLMLRGQLIIILPVALLSCIPILFFFFSSLYPLLHEIFVSTYRPRIFDRTTKF